MKKLYLAICSEIEEFKIIAYAYNTKEARKIIQDSLEFEYTNFVEEQRLFKGPPFNREQFIQETKNVIINYFSKNNFKLIRINSINQVPFSWRNSFPWNDNSDNVIELSIKEILIKNKQLLKKEKEKKLIFIKEQAERLDKILQKKGVDVLFLYSLIDHGLDEEIVSYWKDNYFKKLNGFKYFSSSKEGKLQGDTIYIDKSKDSCFIVWALGDFDIDDKNRKLVSMMMGEVCSLIDRNKLSNILRINGNTINIVEKPVSVEYIKKCTLAGLEYIFYRKYNFLPTTFSA